MGKTELKAFNKIRIPRYSLTGELVILKMYQQIAEVAITDIMVIIIRIRKVQTRIIITVIKCRLSQSQALTYNRAVTYKTCIGATKT